MLKSMLRATVSFSAFGTLLLALSLALVGCVEDDPLDDQTQNGACIRSTQTKESATDDTIDVQVISRWTALPYGFGGGDIFYPVGATNPGFSPVGLIVVSPGCGAKANRVYLQDHARKLARAGFIAATIDFRTSFDFPEHRGDEIIAALNYIATTSSVAHAVDQDLMGAMGHSCGASGSMFAALKAPEKIKAVVSLDTGASGMGTINSFTVAKPLLFTEQLRVPTLNVDCGGDEIVGDWPKRLYAAMPKDTERAYIETKKEGHHCIVGENIEVIDEAILNWFNYYLAGDDSAPTCPPVRDNLRDLRQWRGSCERPVGCGHETPWSERGELSCGVLSYITDLASPGKTCSAGSSVISLAHHDLECPEGAALTSFRIQRPSKNLINYRYQCKYIGDTADFYRSTEPGFHGRKDLSWLDRHPIDCQGAPLKQFNLVDLGEEEMAYEFHCGETALFDLSDHYTQEQSYLLGNLIALDRHEVKCPAGKVLSFVSLVKPTPLTIQYHYRCGAVSSDYDDIQNGDEEDIEDIDCGGSYSDHSDACTGDGDCSEGLFCNGITAQCQEKVSDGWLCFRDGVCKSNHCRAGFCVQCKEDSHCGDGEYCNLVTAKCEEEERPNGSLCLHNGACQSGHCRGGFCVECTGDGHCGAGEYCNLVKASCEPEKKPNGSLCLHDGACQSGHCRAGFCVQCTTDGHCSDNQFCSVLPASCKSKKANNSICTRNRECASNNCKLTFFGPRCR